MKRSLALALIAMLILAACNFVPLENESLKQTQMALGVQQTVMAQGGGVNATITAQQATINAQLTPISPAGGEPPGGAPTADLNATQMALSLQQTMAAQPPPAADTPAAPPPPPPAATAPSSGNFNEMMKNASILLYEDMVEDVSEYRYVKRTLDAMGLQYKDDGNAMGWLKSDLLGGKWDLVIIAIEYRTDVSGEYFDYLNSVLQQGTSVILEAFHLDEVSEGAIAPILAKCGVQVYPYVPKTGTTLDVVMWPLGVQHPVLEQPNSGLSFTRARDKWLWSFDLGFQMANTGSGDAQLLLGTNAQEKYQDGTLAVCMGGQLTLQGYSSHSFEYATMYPMWENMIYNALKIRLTGSY